LTPLIFDLFLSSSSLRGLKPLLGCPWPSESSTPNVLPLNRPPPLLPSTLTYTQSGAACSQSPQARGLKPGSHRAESTLCLLQSQFCGPLSQTSLNFPRFSVPFSFPTGAGIYLYLSTPFPFFIEAPVLRSLPIARQPPNWGSLDSKVMRRAL
jgi:hypothetical protein